MMGSRPKSENLLESTSNGHGTLYIFRVKDDQEDAKFGQTKKYENYNPNEY